MNLAAQAGEWCCPGERAATAHREGADHRGHRLRRPAGVVTPADNEALLPGLVDSRMHVNEPGRTEWEGFVTAIRAAAPAA